MLGEAFEAYFRDFASGDRAALVERVPDAGGAVNSSGKLPDVYWYCVDDFWRRIAMLAICGRVINLD
jgi:hypothetical protein